MFSALGMIVALYTLYAVYKGEVYARSGPWGRVVARQQSPEYFWIVVVIYLGLSAALIFLF